MKTSEVLRAARGRIEVPERWTKGKFAKNECGQEVYYRDPKAACWCTMGAICAVTNCYTEENAAFRALSSQINRSIAAWNDSFKRTHPEVLAALERESS